MFTTEKAVTFLETLSETGSVTAASRAAFISRVTAYNHRKNDLEFASAWDEALKLGIAALEDEARRRAHQGVEEPVFYKGGICGFVTKYSDTLLIFLMKAHDPEKYRERSKVELVGKNDGPIETKNTTLSDDELDARILELAAKAGSARSPSES